MSIKHATAEPGQAHERKALEALKAEDPAWHVAGHDGKHQLVYAHPVYGRVPIPNSPRSRSAAIQATVQKARKKRRQAEGHLGAMLQMLRTEFEVPDDGYVDVKFNVTERVRKYVESRPDKHHISQHALLQQVTSSGIELIDRKQGIRRIPGKNYVGDGSDDKGTPQGTVQPDAEKAEGSHVTSTKAYLLPEVSTPWVREFLRSKHPELDGNARMQAHFEAQNPDRLDGIVKKFRADHPTMTPTYVADYLGVRVQDVLASIDRLREAAKVEAQQHEDEDHRIRIEVGTATPPRDLTAVEEDRKALLADPDRLFALEDAGKVPVWVDSALLRKRPTTCPNCGSPGQVRGETPGIESSGIDFTCGNIWDDSGTSDFKGRKITAECRRRRDAKVAEKARQAEKPPVPLADHLDAATAEAVANLNEPGVGVVIPAEVVGPLRGYFVGDLEAKVAAANERIEDLEQRLAYAVEQLQVIRKAAAEAAELTE